MCTNTHISVSHLKILFINHTTTESIIDLSFRSQNLVCVCFSTKNECRSLFIFFVPARNSFYPSSVNTKLKHTESPCEFDLCVCRHFFAHLRLLTNSLAKKEQRNDRFDVRIRCSDIKMSSNVEFPSRTRKCIQTSITDHKSFSSFLPPRVTYSVVWSTLRIETPLFNLL